MAKKAAGFISLHRQIVDWEWYKVSPVKDLFIHLLLSANFTDGRFQGETIRRGQLATSLPSLASETGMTVQQIRTALTHLKATGEITDRSNRRYRVITILKYDDYQRDADKSTDQTTGYQHSNNSLSTGYQQTDNRQITGYQQQYNNNNKGIKEKGNKEITPTGYRSSAQPEHDIWFEEFWEAYPRKVSKADAIKAWKQLKITFSMASKIMAGLDRWKHSDQWIRDDGRFIPYPASWLRGKRWEDEVTANAFQGQERLAPPRPRRNSADNFQQRDYSGVDQDLMAELAADIQKMREEGG